MTTISKRKQDHINVCKESPVEGTAEYGFESLQFIHNALPELSWDELSTEISFLNKTIRLPLFISCMTGGSEEGLLANKVLAKAAQKMNIPLGLGSMRVLFDNPERISDFDMRSLAPDVPLMGNIGAVQLRDGDPQLLSELIQRLDLDALVIHLNCGQELFQNGGDTDFRGLKEAIKRAVNTYDLPLIVKETGFGIRPMLARELVEAGVAYIDVAGSGGTNWILVEKFCENNHDTQAHEFTSWGNATAALLDATRDFSGKILASGGLRTGMDLAKSLALGAVAGGMALPFIRAALEEGEEGVCKLINQLHQTLKKVMLLTGSQTIDELRQAPLLRSIAFKDHVSSLITADLKE